MNFVTHHLELMLFKMQKQKKQRLAVWCIMNGNGMGFFVLLAVVCTSFSAVNIGTSLRAAATPMGDCSKHHVRVPGFACFIFLISCVCQTQVDPKLVRNFKWIRKTLHLRKATYSFQGPCSSPTSSPAMVGPG